MTYDQFSFCGSNGSSYTFSLVLSSVGHWNPRGSLDTASGAQYAVRGVEEEGDLCLQVFYLVLARILLTSVDPG